MLEGENTLFNVAEEELGLHLYSKLTSIVSYSVVLL